jgi:hypothetical protein
MSRNQKNTSAITIPTPPFRARKIVPIFAEAPEWLVEHKGANTELGTLVCWCPSEFSARLIANALNGD